MRTHTTVLLVSKCFALDKARECGANAPPHKNFNAVYTQHLGLTPNCNLSPPGLGSIGRVALGTRRHPWVGTFVWPKIWPVPPLSRPHSTRVPSPRRRETLDRAERRNYIVGFPPNPWPSRQRFLRFFHGAQWRINRQKTCRTKVDNKGRLANRTSISSPLTVPYSSFSPPFLVSLPTGWVSEGEGNGDSATNSFPLAECLSKKVQMAITALLPPVQ